MQPTADIDGLVVEVLRSAEDVRAIVPEWDVLRANARRASPNADPRRFLATCEAVGDRPYLALARREGKVVAMVVARSSRRRMHHRLGYAGFRTWALRLVEVVYGGLVTDGSEVGSQALGLLLARIQRERDCTALCFNHCDVREQEMIRDACRASAVWDEGQPHIEFRMTPGDWEETLGQLSSKRRYQFRREMRLLSERFDGRVRIERFDGAGRAEEFGELAGRIASKTYKVQIGAAFDAGGLSRALVEVDARQGHMRGWVLFGGDEPIAFVLGWKRGDRFHLEHLGFDPGFSSLSPGKCLLVRAMESLCVEDQTRSIDFGFGDAAYKRVFCSESWVEASGRVYASTLEARVAFLLDAGTGRIRKAVEGSRIAGQFRDSVRRAWRRRLTPASRGDVASDHDKRTNSVESVRAAA